MIVALIVTAAVLFLLFSPTHIIVKYQDEEAKVYVRLFYLVRINALKSGKRIAKSTGKKDKKQEHKPVAKKSKSATEKMEQLQLIFRIVLRSLKQFCKSFKLYKCKAHLLIAGDDPANVAVEFGAVNALVYSTVSLLEEKMKVQNKDICIQYDYNKIKPEFEIDFRFSVILLKFVFMLICVNWRDIIHIIQHKNEEE